MNIQSTRRHHHDGFTLLEMVIVLAIFGILVAIAWPAYQKHIRQTRLQDARAALLENGQFMERFYAQNGRFKATSTTWPALPRTETEHFNLTFSGGARGTLPDTYKLQAIAKDKEAEPRWLVLDHHQMVQLCIKNNNKTTCAEF